MQAATPVAEPTSAVPGGPPTPSPGRPGDPDGAHPAVRAAARALVVVTVGSAVAAAVLDVVTPAAAREAAHATPGWVFGLPGIGLALPAALLLRREPRNAVSWVVGGTALLWAVDGLAQSWLTSALQHDPPLPGGTLAFWLVQRFGAWLLLGLPLLLLLYPHGRLPTAWWRPVALISLACTALLPTLLMVVPSEIADARAGSETPEIYRSLDLDPTSLPLPEAVVLPLLRFAFPAAVLGVLVPVAVVLARYRAAAGEDRRRMRWLLWAAVTDGLVMVGTLVAPGDISSVTLSLAVTLTGAAVAVGILRPQAVDIDRLLGGTLVYGGLAVAVVLLDLAVIAAAGALLGDRLGDRDATLLALLVVTGLYVPLRAQAWRLVRRWVFGEREDPYRVVSGLAERLERSDGAEEQLMAVAAGIAEAFRSPYVGVEVDQPGGQHLLAESGHRPAAVQSLPIAYRGEQVGRLLLPRDGVRAHLVTRDEGLLADVVRQAAAAARAGSLAAELQASREQLVAAREEERRRLRRDLHDGLGPSLGAVVLRIDTARNLAVSRPEEADRLLRQARDDVSAALADVRRLVHDLRPPALDDLGLAGAVRQQAERLLAPRVGVTVDPGELAELPAAVEVAAYRIASEALANVAKHASATRVRVSLACDGDGDLVVEVADDGVGIAPGAPAGVGLVSLRERAAELGGRCSVECPASGGTVVRAVLPADGRGSA
ncbi:sensor histidine kinase [Geodermatophilus sabuli]|uniref:histidine kinase n=1 Tax=Geodermatophilus sabuli TaxID=1564158 RepID=A0A285EAV5_9ACTN|nr:sensor histidine kinase [Geodermatophilus sabuli]MBB3085458.1 signal transduction histidine kinase [Geodermatophilus sabuli]SNX96117.1 Histidine kinase-, DNA gyrase B-, and HSP90-like ATPase [Geodermatophilus sabuli]